MNSKNSNEIFEVVIKENQIVNKGDLLIKVDLNKLSKQLEILTILTNDSEKQIEFILNSKKVDNNSIMFIVK